MKTCTKCRALKGLDKFAVRDKSLQTRASWCRDCVNTRDRERRKKDPSFAQAGRDAGLKYRYGITREELTALLEEQGGCAVCSRKDPGLKNWCVDHDHSCCPGRTSCGSCIRGILCHSCNIAIGILRDDPAILDKAARYVLSRRDVLGTLDVSL